MTEPGRQVERTRLAWRRTALAMTVVTGLLVRLALTEGTAGVLLAATALLGWAGLMFLLRPWRAGPPPRAAPQTPRKAAPQAPQAAPQTPRAATERPPAPLTTSAGRMLPLIAFATVGYAGLGVLLVLSTLG